VHILLNAQVGHVRGGNNVSTLTPIPRIAPISSVHHAIEVHHFIVLGTVLALTGFPIVAPPPRRCKRLSCEHRICMLRRDQLVALRIDCGQPKRNCCGNGKMCHVPRCYERYIRGGEGKRQADIQYQLKRDADNPSCAGAQDAIRSRLTTSLRDYFPHLAHSAESAQVSNVARVCVTLVFGDSLSLGCCIVQA